MEATKPLAAWRDDGTLARLHDALRAKVRAAAGRDPDAAGSTPHTASPTRQNAPFGAPSLPVPKESLAVHIGIGYWSLVVEQG